MFRKLGLVIVTGVLVSVFWVVYIGISGGFAPGGTPAPTPAEVSNEPAKQTFDPLGPLPPVAVATTVEVGPAGLAIPVTGVKPRNLVDTFTQARAGGARVHDAIDIMAATGTPVIAAAPGTVEKLFFSKGGGGISAYVRSEDGRWTYYYAHLSAYAPGLREGQKLRRGDPVGYVGFTGNANPAGPHLHFAINRMAPGEKWYQGAPVNPYPLLAGKAVSR